MAMPIGERGRFGLTADRARDDVGFNEIDLAVDALRAWILHFVQDDGEDGGKPGTGDEGGNLAAHPP